MLTQEICRHVHNFYAVLKILTSQHWPFAGPHKVFNYPQWSAADATCWWSRWPVTCKFGKLPPARLALVIVTCLGRIVGLRGPGVQGSGGQLPSFNVPAKTVAPAVDCNCRCCSYYAINEIWPATNWASPGSSRWAGLFPEQSENMKVEIGYGQTWGWLLTSSRVCCHLIFRHLHIKNVVVLKYFIVYFFISSWIGTP